MRSKDTDFAAIKVPRCVVGGGGKSGVGCVIMSVQFDETVAPSTREHATQHQTTQGLWPDRQQLHPQNSARSPRRRWHGPWHGRLQHFYRINQLRQSRDRPKHMYQSHEHLPVIVGSIRPRKEKSHCGRRRVSLNVNIMFHKNKMGSTIRSSGTKYFSVLYLNSRLILLTFIP